MRSGWDFSSRWRKPDRLLDPSSTETRYVIPVDLNCILFRMGVPRRYRATRSRDSSLLT